WPARSHGWARDRLGRKRTAGRDRRTCRAPLRGSRGKGRRRRVIGRAFHAWERRLASVDQNRIVRPFAWGLDWLGLPADAEDPAAALSAYTTGVMSDSDAFYSAP